jgi:hypothetical protein
MKTLLEVKRTIFCETLQNGGGELGQNKLI